MPHQKAVLPMQAQKPEPQRGRLVQVLRPELQKAKLAP